MSRALTSMPWPTCEVRVATEPLIDTGRGPEEVCALPLDCLARDSDGAPVLVYENRKAHRRCRKSGQYRGSARRWTAAWRDAEAVMAADTRRLHLGRPPGDRPMTTATAAQNIPFGRG